MNILIGNLTIEDARQAILDGHIEHIFEAPTLSGVRQFTALINLLPEQIYYIKNNLDADCFEVKFNRIHRKGNIIEINRCDF